jgi:ATP-dependent DNA helicase RecQ
VRVTNKQKRAEARAVMGADPQTDRLLARLKTLRSRLANERRVPAYVIFSDRSLIDMAMKRPKTLDEFSGVHGVGAAKLAEFGKVFLAEISAGARGN